MQKNVLEDLQKFKGMEGKERLESLVRNLSAEIEKEMSEINRIWTKNKQRKYVRRIQPSQCARTDLKKRFLPKPMTTTG